MSSASPPSEPADDDSPGEATWTMGEAAAYLNAGGVDFGFDARAVRRMADNPDIPIRTVRAGVGRWRRALAGSVRAYRAQLLRDAGRRDPESPTPGGSQPPETGAPPTV